MEGPSSVREVGRGGPVTGKGGGRLVIISLKDCPCMYEIGDSFSKTQGQPLPMVNSLCLY